MLLPVVRRNVFYGVHPQPTTKLFFRLFASVSVFQPLCHSVSEAGGVWLLLSGVCVCVCVCMYNMYRYIICTAFPCRYEHILYGGVWLLLSGSVIGFSPRDISQPLAPGLKWEEVGLEEVLRQTRSGRLAQITNEYIKVPSGLRWKKIMDEPTAGMELTNVKLATALKSKTVFSHEEWVDFGIQDLRIDNYVVVRSALGLKWKEDCSEKPTKGTEIMNEVLAAALQSKIESEDFVELEKEEWESFQVANLSSDSYVKVGDNRRFIPLVANEYFKPAEEGNKYFKPGNMTSETSAARNLVPAAFYSGNGVCISNRLCARLCQDV